MGYGRQVGGRHPIGMLSCCIENFHFLFKLDVFLAYQNYPFLVLLLFTKYQSNRIGHNCVNLTWSHPTHMVPFVYLFNVVLSPSNMVLIVTDCLAISTSTSNISPSELCSFMFGICEKNKDTWLIIFYKIMALSILVHWVSFTMCSVTTSSQL